MGGLATSPLLSWGSPTLQSGGQNQKWAHMWAVWLHHPCCLRGPQRFKAGDKIRNGPTCGRFAYIPAAVSGVPNASKRGTKLEMGPHVGRLATSPLLSRGSPTLQSGGQNQKWAHMWAVCLHPRCCLGGPQRFKAGDKIRIGPTCGRIDCITLAVSESPLLQSRGQNQNRAHMWADWLHHPCCLGGPQRFKAGDKIRNGPACGRFGYITPAVSGGPKCSQSPLLSRGGPNAPKRGTKSEMGPRVGRLATSPVLSRGSPMLQAGHKIRNGPTCGELWLHHPCCLGGSHCFTDGDKIRIGPTCGRFGYITPASQGPHCLKAGGQPH